MNAIKIAAERATQSTEKNGNKIIFLQNSVKKGNLKVRVRYGFPEDGSIAIYAKDYGRNLKKIFPNAKNVSDTYEKSRVRIYSESHYFADAKKMADKKAGI